VFMPDIVSLIQDSKDPLEVDLAIGPFCLRGWLTGLYAEGCIRYRPAKLKGRDLLKLWVEHLVYNTLNQPGYLKKSVYVASDKTITFRPVENPLIELHKLLKLYWQGLSMPLHFYPESSHACFKGKEGRKEIESQKAWNSGYMKRGEGEDIEYRIAFQGNQPLDQEFAQIAESVYGPLYEHLEDGNADV